jgi:hypothetical protein
MSCQFVDLYGTGLNVASTKTDSAVARVRASSIEQSTMTRLDADRDMSLLKWKHNF